MEGGILWPWFRGRLKGAAERQKGKSMMVCPPLYYTSFLCTLYRHAVFWNEILTKLFDGRETFVPQR